MDKIYVAKLGRAVGLKGQQKLIIDSDFPEQFKKNSKFFTDKNQELTIETYSTNNSVVKFVGIDTIEDAKKITNKQLFVSQEDTKKMCNLDNKQFFWFDMLNCIIKENDKELGKVTDIQRMPLSDYLEIETTKILQDKEYANRFLLPYIDDFIIDVDIENKIILVQNAMDILEAS
ncbi:MAG: 16S rRNA processing protein RimM [Epsilonproteobacteria bacterium]|nr:MAG: 16S rRNA processing protein RimM [Campylobacterota bacterium]